MKIKFKINKILKHRNLSVNQLRIKAGLSLFVVQNIVNNTVQNVSIIVLLKLSKALEVKLEELYEIEEEEWKNILNILLSGCFIYINHNIY